MTSEGPKYRPYATPMELLAGIIVGVALIGVAIAFVTFA